MFRGLTLTATLLFATLEPVLGGETDLPRYAITQGGLLAVVLVLLWYIRELHKQRDGASDQTIESLTSIVAETNVSMQKNISVGEAQEKAIDRLAHAVERLDERRGSVRQ
jgi:hypothetical protein